MQALGMCIYIQSECNGQCSEVHLDEYCRVQCGGGGESYMVKEGVLTIYSSVHSD